jgi:hypothetical protein
VTGRHGAGHGTRCAPSQVHEGFARAVMGYDEREMRLAGGMLFRCTAALPDDLRRWLGMSAGATYGEAASRVWHAASLRATDWMPPVADVDGPPLRAR